MKTKLYLTFFLLLSLWYWPQLKWLAYTPVVVLILALPHRTQHCQHSLVLPMDCTPAAKELGKINPGFRNAYLPHSGKPDFSPHDVKQHKRGRNTHTLFLNILWPWKEMSWSGCLWPLTAYLLYAARPSITPCAPFFNPSHTCHLHPLIVRRQKSLISVLVGKVCSCFCSSCYKRDLMVIHGSDRQHIIPHSASLIFLAKTWIDYHSHSLWPELEALDGGKELIITTDIAL